MTRGGRQDEITDARMCIASREVLPRAQLIRLVVGPAGDLVPDLARKLPGRGIWIAARRPAIETAVKKRLFARAAKAPVEVPADLADRLEAGLLRRVSDLLSLARKAGLAVAGYEKVKAMIDSGGARVLIQASDGSERGKTKLRLPADEGETLGLLTSDEIGLSFGRERVIHAALGAGSLTRLIVEDAHRLAGLRASIGDTTPERTMDSHERQ